MKDALNRESRCSVWKDLNPEIRQGCREGKTDLILGKITLPIPTIPSLLTRMMTITKKARSTIRISPYSRRNSDSSSIETAPTIGPTKVLNPPGDHHNEKDRGTGPVDFAALRCYKRFISESCRIHHKSNKSNSMRQESLLKAYRKKGLVCQ